MRKRMMTPNERYAGATGGTSVRVAKNWCHFGLGVEIPYRAGPSARAWSVQSAMCTSSRSGEMSGLSRKGGFLRFPGLPDAPETPAGEIER